MLGQEDGVRSFKDLLKDDGGSFPSDGISERTETSIMHKDSCVLPYSSGTTGKYTRVTTRVTPGLHIWLYLGLHLGLHIGLHIWLHIGFVPAYTQLISSAYLSIRLRKRFRFIVNDLDLIRIKKMYYRRIKNTSHLVYYNM